MGPRGYFRLAPLLLGVVAVVGVIIYGCQQGPFGRPRVITLSPEQEMKLGACAAVRGQYARAVDRFRDGLARCDKLGARAYVQRSSLLLNVALLHKSQGDTAAALIALEEALAAYKHYAEPDALGFAAFDAARASLYAARNRLAEAHALAPRILTLCKKYEIGRTLLDQLQLTGVARAQD